MNKKIVLLWLLLLTVSYITCKKANETPDAKSHILDFTAFKSNPASPDNNSFSIALDFKGSPGTANPLWFLAKR
jgi:hypothetical protein